MQPSQKTKILFSKVSKMIKQAKFTDKLQKKPTPTPPNSYFQFCSQYLTSLPKFIKIRPTLAKLACGVVLAEMLGREGEW